MKKHVVQIAFEAPDDADRSSIREFIQDALSTWGGQRQYDDPLFNSLENVKVQFKNRRTTRKEKP
jgi:hypothetical protein